VLPAQTVLVAVVCERRGRDELAALVPRNLTLSRHVTVQIPYVARTQMPRADGRRDTPKGQNAATGRDRRVVIPVVGQLTALVPVIGRIGQVHTLSRHGDLGKVGALRVEISITVFSEIQFYARCGEYVVVLYVVGDGLGRESRRGSMRNRPDQPVVLVDAGILVTHLQPALAIGRRDGEI